MSKFGLALCLTYLLVILVCVGFSLSTGGDFKGQFVFAQLPIAVQGSLAVGLGLGPVLEKLSWPEAYLLLAGPTFVLLYALGWLMTGVRRRFLSER